MPEAPFALFGTRIYQVWNDLDILLGEHPHYSNHPDHTASNEPVLTDVYGNVIISENDEVVPIKTNLNMEVGAIQTDTISVDVVEARTAAGLKLTDDGDAGGVFIRDGGNVGISDTTPDYRLDVNGTARVTGDAIFEGELAGAPYSFILSNSAGGSVTTAGIYLKAGEIPMTATKGLVMRKAGSIIGVSIQYDITVDNTDIEIQVHKNGANVWGNAINDTVAADKKDSFTQARDTDTFAAEDIITVLVIAPSGPGPWTDIDDMIVTLDVVYD